MQRESAVADVVVGEVEAEAVVVVEEAAEVSVAGEVVDSAAAVVEVVEDSAAAEEVAVVSGEVGVAEVDLEGETNPVIVHFCTMCPVYKFKAFFIFFQMTNDIGYADNQIPVTIGKGILKYN